MPDYNASAECRVWSPESPQTFQGLCSMIMTAETGNTTLDCEVCVKPINAAVTPPPLDPCSTGSSAWQWMPATSQWSLIQNNCPLGCTPTAPTSPGITTNPSDPVEYGVGGCQANLVPGEQP